MGLGLLFKVKKDSQAVATDRRVFLLILTTLLPIIGIGWYYINKEYFDKNKINESYFSSSIIAFILNHSVLIGLIVGFIFWNLFF